jgi:ubiquinone/menaquinone biosynthesis C-methylase UbiE
MGFYSQVIFPRLMDWSMSTSELTPYRQAALAEVSGHVLEIGFGTGLNLPYYPPEVRQVTTIDVNPGMQKLAAKRIHQSSLQVTYAVLNGEHLPMPDGTFDSVVSTWTLCSILNVEQALQEIYRVLKPGGKFFFVEHGLSHEPTIQTWQHRLTPIQKIIGDGCHLDRNIQELVQQRFEILDLQTSYAKGLPKTIGYFYQGVAIKV